MLRATALAIAFLCALTSAALAADRPSQTFCWWARQARDMAGSEKAAEDIARAKHVPEATIARAKRCLR